MIHLDASQFITNPDPRCPCVLLLDTSGSMTGARINALNDGLRAFQDAIVEDPLAQRRAEIAMITFGKGGVTTVQDFALLGDQPLPTLQADGTTPMGEAIQRGLTLLQNRKDAYRQNGIQYYRPWVFLITDGAPTDEWQTAAKRARDLEQERGLTFFAVGVEGADMNVLSQIAVRPPLLLRGLGFREMFIWLSGSMSAVSASTTEETCIPLPEVNWSYVGR